MKKPLKYFYIGCAAFLFLAFIHWSYSYYQLLRIITFVGAVSIAYTEWRLYKDNFTGYMLIFLIIAILFNPLVPIYLKQKSIWTPIDIFSGFAFLSYAFYPKEKKKTDKRRGDEVSIIGRDKFFLLKKTDKRSKTIKKTKILLIKIVLTIGVIIIGTVFQAIISESGLDHTAGVRLIPGMILVFGIILIWRKKNQNFINYLLWIIFFFISIILVKIISAILSNAH